MAPGFAEKGREAAKPTLLQLRRGYSVVCASLALWVHSPGKTISLLDHTIFGRLPQFLCKLRDIKLC